MKRMKTTIFWRASWVRRTGDDSYSGFIYFIILARTFCTGILMDVVLRIDNSLTLRFPELLAI